MGAGGAAAQAQLAVDLAPAWEPLTLKEVPKIERPLDLFKRMDEKSYPHEAIASKTYDQMSTAQRDAIDNFTLDAYVPMRKIDSGMLIYNESYSLDTFNKVKAQVDEINAAFDKTPVFNEPVYRGLSALTEETVNKMLQNPEMHLEAVTSATYEPAQGLDFAHRAYDRGADAKYGVLFKIENPRGMLIENVSGIKKEREVLLKKGSKFKMTKVERFKDRGKNIVMVTMEGQ